MTDKERKSFSEWGVCTHPVGAGLLAKAVCQSLNAWLIHRLREQARSHRGICATLSYFCAPSSCCRFAWVIFAPAGTLRVSHTLPPMVDPLPMVMRPRIVAPA